MKILKITLIILFIAIMAFAGYIYLNRESLFNQGIDRILTNLLPEYILIDELRFDFEKKSITVKDFRMRNPKGFSHEYLAEIPLITCLYNQQDKESSLNGINISNIKLSEAKIHIDRNRSGRINLTYMNTVLKDSAPSKKAVAKNGIMGLFSYILSPVKDISRLLRIDPVFDISDGTLIFTDKSVGTEGFEATVNNIKARISLDLKKGFKGINYLWSDGSGIVNNTPAQQLKWDTEYNPKTEKITMLNTLNLKNVNIVYFNPYYDRFLPFTFKRAAASGEIIFNLDNGEIGSMNEIRLSGLEIERKKGSSFDKFWPGGTEEILSYLQNSSGAVLVDFKIKGPIKQPRFYLGSKIKQALAQMVVYKLADTFLNKDEDQDDSQQPSDTSADEQSDVEKVLSILKNL